MKKCTILIMIFVVLTVGATANANLFDPDLNPGFEDGDAEVADWSDRGTHTFRSTTEMHSGVASLGIDQDNYTGGTRSYTFSFGIKGADLNAILTPDTMYELSCWVKTCSFVPAEEGAGAGCRLVVTGTGGGVYATNYLSGSNDWTKVSTIFTTAADLSGLTVDSRVDAFFDGTAGQAWIDDLSLTVIPEPATLSLLALGAMALIRRKR